MPEAPRFVADTNVLVSRLLFRHSQPAQALRHAMSSHRLLVSPETLIELGTVLLRPKFDRYLSLSERLQFFDRLRRLAVHISDVPPIIACRDPKDDKFLALALAGRAIFILSGDDDLLTLHTPSATSPSGLRANTWITRTSRDGHSPSATLT